MSDSFLGRPVERPEAINPEDIDLILDWRVLGYGLYEPWAPRSNTKQDQFNKEANKRAEQFLRDILLPSLRRMCVETAYL